MRLSGLSRTKQVVLSSALVLGLILGAVGIFVAPQEAEACVILPDGSCCPPCSGSKTVCSGCQPWGKKCTDYVLTGSCNLYCTWQAVRTYLVPC